MSNHLNNLEKVTNFHEINISNMTTCLLIIFTFFLLILIGSVAVLTKNWWPRYNKGNSYSLNWQTVFALLVALGLFGFSLIAPFLFTRNSATTDFDFTKTGAIGDTIGGLMNPFIALSGVIVTGLAFYMQYRANSLQRELFNKQLRKDKKRFNKEIKISKDHFQEQISSQNSINRLQQFESQFYEMLRLHKENVNEIELPAKRKVIDNGKVLFEDYYVTKRNAFVEFKSEFEKMLHAIKISELRVIDDKTFKKAYDYFFWGLGDKYEIAQEEIDSQNIHFDNCSLEMVLSSLKNAQFDERLAKVKSITFDFNIVAFDGHSGLLGHYFRHLFSTVKFVVQQDFLSYKKKIQYLKILRAQLSNHEQIMLFYNWLSDYGGAWEDRTNQFFTEYRMIHNLWYNIMPSDSYIQNKVKYLANKKTILRKGEMFEIDNNK